jgi:hypothetical protein
MAELVESETGHSSLMVSLFAGTLMLFGPEHGLIFMCLASMPPVPLQRNELATHKSTFKNN